MTRYVAFGAYHNTNWDSRVRCSTETFAWLLHGPYGPCTFDAARVMVPSVAADLCRCAAWLDRRVTPVVS